METATLAGGCFWCTEAVFKRLKGVESVMPGYAGGTTENPTMMQVYRGNTGHAESVQIVFDPTVISYEKLLEIFFHLHDPTTLNRQGNDVGTEYRSIIFYHSEDQKNTALKAISNIEASKLYPGKIVTEVIPFMKFYPAEASQQEYYEKNSYQPYCQFVIDPKIQKLMKEFASDLKNQPA